MARWRTISRRIWNDSTFRTYYPDKKLIFLYLLTNDNTTSSGVYPVSFEIVSEDTGLPREVVMKIFRDRIKNVTYDYINKSVFVHKYRLYQKVGGRDDLRVRERENDIKENPTPLWHLFFLEYPALKRQHKKSFMDFVNDIPQLTKQHLNPDTYPIEQIRSPAACFVRNLIDNEHPVTIPIDTMDEDFSDAFVLTPDQITVEDKAKVVVDHLNETVGKEFRYSESSLKPIMARLNDGHSVDDCKQVINVKSMDAYFLENPRFLCPQTLFRPSNFERYLNEVPKKKPKPPAKKNQCPFCRREQSGIRIDHKLKGCNLCKPLDVE